MVKRQLRLFHMLKLRREPEKLTFIYTRLYIRLPVNGLLKRAFNAS